MPALSPTYTLVDVQWLGRWAGVQIACGHGARRKTAARSSHDPRQHARSWGWNQVPRI